jgi:uncharacterized protein YecT (DUF1311 family)
MLDQGKSPSNNNTQIWLAVIGLIAALGGAVISNWDKIFTQPTAPSTAPAPTTSSAPLTVASSEIKTYADPVPEPPKEAISQPQQRMPLVGPSFDCAKATYPSERLVCSSPELAVLDLAMANAYRDAAARVATKRRKYALRDLQNHWLRRVREACVDVACLKGIYEQRIRELNAVQR